MRKKCCVPFFRAALMLRRHTMSNGGYRSMSGSSIPVIEVRRSDTGIESRGGSLSRTTPWVDVLVLVRCLIVEYFESIFWIKRYREAKSNADFPTDLILAFRISYQDMTHRLSYRLDHLLPNVVLDRIPFRYPSLPCW